MKALFVMLIAVVASCGGVKKYDALVEANAVCDQKWADIETELQRRYDLIPNLVATVKASAAHEEKVLAEVTAARASATQIKLTADDLTDPAKMAEFTEAQSALTGALGRLLVTQEAYPDLKANAQFHDLMIELEGTENRIARSRQEYNDAVKTYNAELAKVSGRVINKITGKPFKPLVYWSASAAAHEAPKVSF
jgi:LemA protein